MKNRKEYNKELAWRVVGEKDCECGCGGKITLRRYHLFPSRKFPRFLVGHAPYVHFKKGNKLGWKGGEFKTPQGYIVCLSPDHPFKLKIGRGYVKRCRLVMEQKLGRYLSPLELVHHINGIRDDDRIENLVVLTKSKHSSHHSTVNNATLRRREDGRLMKKED